MDEERIAKVTQATLGWEEHGIFTCWLYLNYGNSAQGAGGYALDRYDKAVNHRVGTAWGLEFIMRLMRVFDVQDWGQLVGKTCHAVIQDGRVVGLRPLLTERGSAFMFNEIPEDF